MSLTPSDITARSEHTGMANAGAMGAECLPCARPIAVRFVYDDPLKTPITDLEIRIADMSGGALVDAINTEAPRSRGRQDATAGVGELRPELGGVTHGEVPLSAGALTVSTNPSQDIPSAAEEAWQLEQEIVAALEAFETAMKARFKPYVEEWERDGMLGAAGDFANGVGKGIVSWWEGEKDFWGTALGALKSTAAYIDEANRDGLPQWVPNATLYNLSMKMGSDIAGWFKDSGIMDFLGNLSGLLRAILAGDIAAIGRELKTLTGLEKLSGIYGEFGAMLKEALANGIDWMRDMLETFRRTPVLNLSVNTAMRCMLLMTPNFWAKVLGEGTGFIIPELLIWLVTALIAALSAGAASAVLYSRCANIMLKIRSAIKGSRHVSNILAFLDGLGPVLTKIRPLGAKLRQSIDEKAKGIANKSHQIVRSTRYWRTRLDDLARQGHGPQRHEGDVTDRQLFERVYHGYDPMTGTVWDGVRRGQNGQRVAHRSGKHATKFNTPADYVRAYDEIIKTQDYKNFISSTQDSISIEIKMSDIFGGNFQIRLKGYSVVSGKSGYGPIITPTQFPGNTVVKAIFRRNKNGTPYLLTMYPNF